MKRILRVALMAVLFAVIVTSFIPVDRQTASVDGEMSFENYSNGNEEMYNLVKTACYDCHSNETEYPWYSNVSPAKFILQDHINEGRHEFNFSEWGTMPLKDRNHILEECAEEVEEKEMPLKGYALLHGDANLSNQQRSELANYFLSLMK
jgi:hypothetical protein